MTGFVPPEGLTDFIVIFFPLVMEMAVGSTEVGSTVSSIVPST